MTDDEYKHRWSELASEPKRAAQAILDTPSVLSEIQRERGRRGGLAKSAAKSASGAVNTAKATAARLAKRREASE